MMKRYNAPPHWMCLCLLVLGCQAESGSVVCSPGAPGCDAPDGRSEAEVTASASRETTPSDAEREQSDAGTIETSRAIAWEQKVADEDWTWLSRHDGQVAGAHDYASVPNQYYEYTRFEVFQPFEVRAIRVVPSVTTAQDMTFYLWDDLGGNFLHPDGTAPLLEIVRPVTPEDSGEWLELMVQPPLRLDPGRMFYVGTIINGEEGARIAIDAELTPTAEEVPASSLIWLSQDLDEATQTYTVFGAGSGDLMVEVEIRHVDAVQDDDFIFEEASVEAFGFKGASSYFDLEGDGDIDGASGTELWVNDGTGFFTQVAEGVMPEGVSGRGHWADFDNDGDQDVLLTGQEEFLLRNDGGVFTDITATSGIDDSQLHTCNGVTSEGHVPTETATWVDFNNDGLLDIYLGNFICWDDGFAAKDMLFRNDGAGQFTDVSTEAGLYLWQGYGFASRSTAPVDYDNDGDTDILVNNYRLHRNLMWRNGGDGTFSDVALQNLLAGTQKDNGAFGHSISSAWADFDHDGYLDVFVANLAHPRFLHFSDKARLYMSSGGDDPTFQDVTDAMGLRFQETAGGAIAWDYDNDGDQDLTWNCIYANRRSQFYRNDWPNGGFKEVTYPTGLVIDNGWEVSVVDLDDDGDLDYTANKYWDIDDDDLFINRNPWGRQSVQVRPLGKGEGGTNRDGFGARLKVMVDGVERIVEKVPSSGVSNQSSPWLHVGLGSQDSADVTVVFPVTGSEWTFVGLAAGRYTVTEDGQITQER